MLRLGLGPAGQLAEPDRPPVPPARGRARARRSRAPRSQTPRTRRHRLRRNRPRAATASVPRLSRRAHRRHPTRPLHSSGRSLRRYAGACCGCSAGAVADVRQSGTALKLQLVQAVIDPAPGQQFLVRALTRAARPCAARECESMSWIVESRWAMAIVVRRRITTCSASRISSSVSVSTLDVASSRMSTGGSNASARANDSSCFCPTDSVAAALGHRRVEPAAAGDR